jgi:hypothetical protein
MTSGINKKKPVPVRLLVLFAIGITSLIAAFHSIRSLCTIVYEPPTHNNITVAATTHSPSSIMTNVTTPTTWFAPVVTAAIPGSQALLPSLSKSTSSKVDSNIPAANSGFNDSNYTSYQNTADLIGGLGNKLWIFLSTLGIARKIGARAVFLDDESFRMLNSTFCLDNWNSRFTLLNSSTLSLDGFGRWNQGGPHEYDRSFERIDRNTVIKGYLHNPKFSANDSDSFARTVDLELQPKVITEARELMNELGSFWTETIVSNWVGLHVRRYPDRHTKERGPSPEAIERQVNQVLHHCEEESLLTPLQRNISLKNPLNSSLSPCCALVFSNDPPWAKQYLNGIRCARFVENEFLEDPALSGKMERNNGWATHFGRDMAAMTMCDSLVLTVGTFGYFCGILHGHKAAVQRRIDLHGVGDVDGAPGNRSADVIYMYDKSNSAKYGLYPSTWRHWG